MKNTIKSIEKERFLFEWNSQISNFSSLKNIISHDNNYIIELNNIQNKLRELITITATLIFGE